MVKKSARKKHPKRTYLRGIKKGLAPGTPVFVGQRRLDRPTVDVTCYNAESLQELVDAGIEDIRRLERKKNVTWIDVNGIHDIALIETISAHFGLHPLTIEDIVNSTQRPKAEEFDNYTFVVLKMITYESAAAQLNIENVSLVLGDDFVISFQEYAGDVFNPVRERIRSSKGRIRKLKSDYLAYALMDAIIDEYYSCLENIGESLEAIDEDMATNAELEHLKGIHRFKHEMLFLRRSVWPLREVVSMLEKSESRLVDKSTRIFLRDLYDHTIQVIDMVETYRDILGGMHDTYLSSVNNRLNDIMRTLTVISTIFIPLTFIAGVYGMNFEHMPELAWQGGYFATLAFMGLIAAGMLVYFWKKGWFRS